MVILLNMIRLTSVFMLFALIAVENTVPIVGRTHSNIGTFENSLSALDFGINRASCIDGICSCPTGQQLYEDVCLNSSPYLLSPCEIDIQCERLSGFYHCDSETKRCMCKKGFRYLYGRCWPIAEYGDSCFTKEQCFHNLQPFSMDCIDGTCQCAKNYYTRQIGECRKIANNLNDTCVVNSDCKIDGVPNAICNSDLRCSTENSYGMLQVETIDEFDLKNVTTKAVATKLGGPCTKHEDCVEHGAAECSPQKHCICKIGYYPNKINTVCSAELGQSVPLDGKTVCEGRLAIIVNGVCDCPNGFFYDTISNRDCKKPARFFGDSCGNDDFCYTFGRASHCMQEEESVFVSCNCDSKISSKDEKKQMCALFEKIVGDDCTPEDICPTESECIKDKCKCNDNTIPIPDNSMCVQKELELNMPCLIDEQCTTENSQCTQKKCSCREKYFQSGNQCELAIGGPCDSMANCKIDNSICLQHPDININGTCQCEDGFANDEYKNCLIMSTLGESCEKSSQCWKTSQDRESTYCNNNTCSCVDNYHEANDTCWKSTGLKEVCSKSPQCYLSNGMSDRIECRNSICQCQLKYTPRYFPDTCSGGDISSGFQMNGLYFILLIISSMQYYLQQ